MIVVIWGSRPESIKLGPVVAALRANKTPVSCIATGQHTSLLAGTPAESDLADSLSLGLETTGDVVHWPQMAQPILEDALCALISTTELLPRPIVVVQGDTMSAVAGARAARAVGIPVAHVEAGLRSGNLDDPWPEERFRREITELTTWHFAPTLTAYDNLITEGIDPDHIFLTGNPVVSAIGRYTYQNPVKIPDQVILFTMHRREWVLSGITGVLEGLRESAERYPETTIWWPMHPGVRRVVTEQWLDRLPPNLRVTEPLAYREAIRVLARSLGVATDSGGLVEEAATLGVPCAVLRHVTDRPESIAAGVARLYPPTHKGVIAAMEALRDQVMPRKPSPLYGTHLAAEKIAVTLGTLLRHGVRTQSTSSMLTK